MARPHKIVNNGLRMFGEANPNCKYSDGVCQMLRVLKKYYTYKQLARYFDMSSKTIQKIILYRKLTGTAKIKGGYKWKQKITQ